MGSQNKLKKMDCRVDIEPLVSIVCITYNQEQFISEAIDSFLKQRTTFPFKILVADDHSSDRTPEIILSYAERYPDIVIPVLRTENNGGPKNLRLTYQMTKTKYVAICEGDDYWTDENKLQLQFEFMEGHPEAAACFCNAEILADDDWYLNDYYKRDNQGRMLIPASIPGFDPNKSEYFRYDYLGTGMQAHTSTLFYRRVNELPFLPEYDNLFAGDNALFMMHLSYGYAQYLPQVVSAYRKTNDNHSAIAFKEWRENALTVQMSWVDVLEYLYSWYCKYSYDARTLQSIDNRMQLAAHHYLRERLTHQENEEIARFFVEHPRSSCVALNAYLSYFRDGRVLAGLWGWKSYVRFVRNDGNRRYLARAINRKDKAEKRKTAIRSGWRKVKNVVRYWAYGLIPKDKKLWVATSFRKKGYLDNSRYLYEYIVQHRPEINIVWLTNDKTVLKRLQQEEMPVCKMNSKEGKRCLRRASIAITDHFKSSDYSDSGFNHGTKVVQLWHGSGIKGMKNLGNTKEKGVVYSSDIIPSPNDSLLRRFVKLCKRLACEPKREMQERYLMFLVANEQDRINEGADWHVPAERFFVNGTPRDSLLVRVAGGYCTPEMKTLFDERPEIKYRIIYAPTYRYDEVREHILIQGLCSSLAEINDYVVAHSAEFVIRLHPHTWRGYSDMISWAMKGLDGIRVDKEKDIYATLGAYDLLISDYSSIATDFLLFNRPMVFYRPDHEEFLAEENDLRYDPDEFCPGEKTTSWHETLAAIEAYRTNPKKDGEWRQRICAEVFDPAVNDEDNSERIVNEILRRVGL